MSDPTTHRPGSYRMWPATLAIAAALAAYIRGLIAWDRATPDARPLPAGETVSVGHARFVPAAGWQMDVARSRAGQSLVLFKSGHTFSVKTGRWLGDEASPLARQQRFMERVERVRIDGQVTGFFKLRGLQGTTFAYYGPTTVARFWQMVDASRQSVVQDYYGPPEDDMEALAEAHDMLDRWTWTRPCPRPRPDTAMVPTPSLATLPDAVALRPAPSGDRAAASIDVFFQPRRAAFWLLTLLLASGFFYIAHLFALAWEIAGRRGSCTSYLARSAHGLRNSGKLPEAA